MNRLDTVNALLKNIRVRKVSNLDTLHPDVEDAKDVLEQHKTKILSKGWWCNRVYNIEYQPDSVSGHIQFAPNILHAQLFDERDKGVFQAVTMRDNLLFNAMDNTYVFTMPVALTVYQNLEWNQLPEVMQTYIQYSAAQEYVSDKIADPIKIAELKSLMREAKVDANTDEIVTQQKNLFDNPRIRKARMGRRPFVQQSGRLF